MVSFEQGEDPVSSRFRKGECPNYIAKRSWLRGGCYKFYNSDHPPCCCTGFDFFLGHNPILAWKIELNSLM